MSTKSEFSKLLEGVSRSKLPGQTDSKALLYWFLFNVFRLDETQARDSICDGNNDKGVDGLWVDEDTEEIFLFQSVYTAKQGKTLGDKDLKDFVASAIWFSNVANVKKLLGSGANPELKALVTRFQLVQRMEEGFETKLTFVTTRALDQNGNEYLQTLAEQPTLDVWDQPRLVGQYKYLERKTRVSGKHTLHSTLPGINYAAEHGIRVHVRPVRASDIAAMKGISDRSLFSLNVRLGLGRTRVNKELEKAVREKGRHHHFMLFHNGVTIICRKLTVWGKRVKVEDYSIVNGCQSAIAFFENRKHLSDKLLVLTRFIEVGGDDALAEEITYRTNNQNGINLRDLRSNDRIQLALKKQFQTEFAGQIEYVIKSGEQATTTECLPNDKAGQFIMALYLDEPYNAHQKYRLFGTDYERVFGREMSATKVYLAYLLYEAVETSIEKMEDPLIRSYQLTKFIILGLVGHILRRDKLGRELLNRPTAHLPKSKESVGESARILASQLVADFNFFVKEKKQAQEYYDYKSEFKSPDKYRAIAHEAEKNYDRALARNPKDSFENIFSERLEQQGTQS